MSTILKQIAGNQSGTTSVRKRRAAYDLEYFGREYLPHYFSRPSPPFHRDLDRIWQDGVLKGINPVKREEAIRVNREKGSRHAVAAPRGHAKSTNLTFKDALHSACYGYKRYIIILSDSSEQSEGFLDSIKSELEENEKLIEDFGKLVGDVWRNNVIVLKNGVKIEAIGSGKKIRGRKHKNWRPDLIILDDVENDENVRTKDQRQKLLNWYYKAVSKAGDSYTDIVYIGTLLHYDSLLANVLKNPAYKSVKYKAVLSFAINQSYWDKWREIYIDLDNDNREQDALFYFEQNRDAMLEGTQVLWEEKNSYYDLMVAKVTEGDSSFNSELQNEPINPDDCLFQPEWFDYYNETEVDFRDRAFIFYGFIDPSLGKTKKSDYSAIITVAKNTNSGYLYVVDADIDRRHPDKIIADAINKQIWLKNTFGRGYKQLGAETNQFQWFLKEQLAKESAKAGVYLPIKEVQAASDKVMRIESMQPDIKNKYIKFNKRHKTLMEQLEQFPMGAHDDGPDALQGAVTLAKGKNKLKFVDRRLLGL